MKWIDLPPVWLFGFACLVWASRGMVQAGHPLLQGLGTLLVGLGLAAMIAAVLQMRRQRTTVIPHRQPTALVTGGIFRFSRNPIYLGDALVLAGLALRWDAPLGLLAVPVFIWVIQRRFILAEEARLQAGFPAAFDQYSAQTRRWL